MTEVYEGDPNAPYQLNCKNWPGMAKTIEEIGELLQPFGKIQSVGGSNVYPWGDVNLSEKVEEEAADLIAALTFLVQKSPLIREEVVIDRYRRKTMLFEAWAAGRTETRYEDIEL